MATVARSGLRLSLLAVAFLAAGPVAAQVATLPAAEEKGTLLHLSEQADRLLTQDRPQVVLRAEVMDANAGKVQAEINKQMTAALERAKAVSAVKTSTGSYSVYQDRQPGQAGNQPLRWHGTQSLTLTGADAAALLDLAGDLQKTGLLMSGMTWQLAPETAKTIQDDLTGEALTRLRQRADKIAASLGTTVDRYKEIRVGNASGIEPPRFRTAAMGVLGKADSAPPPVSAAGEERVTVTVEADVVLKK